LIWKTGIVGGHRHHAGEFKRCDVKASSHSMTESDRGNTRLRCRTGTPRAEACLPRS
jgi:hypothetical protein